MKKIGMVYASVDGQTFKICRRLQAVFEKEGVPYECDSIDDFNPEKITDFEVLLIGASIRYGKHNPKIMDLVLQNKAQLAQVKTAFFSVNLVARKSDKNQPTTNPYLIKFLEKTNWQPNLKGVFAGKLDYQAYSIIDRLLIKLIMKITDGPTRAKKPIEYTDWDVVHAFAMDVLKLFRL